MDDFTCQRCGSKRDLQVHHINYRNVFHEDVSSDLITLCQKCHSEVESRVNNFNKSHFRLVEDFILEYTSEDLSTGGPLDLCRLEIIRPRLFKYLQDRGDYTRSGSSRVIAHFRNKRYRLILRYIEQGYPISYCKARTGFSDAMIRKVYSNPESAIKLIKKEEEEYAETK